MPAVKTGLALCLAASVVMLGIRAPWSAQASSCTALLRTSQGNEICYPPSDIGRAEAQIKQVVTMPPVRPVSAVSHFAHLRLQQILVLQTEVAAGPGRPRAYAIYYLFGKIPRAQEGLPDPASQNPRYLIVSEYVGRLEQHGVTVKRGIGVFRIFNHSTATTSYQPWNLDANLPGRNLALHITSNTSRQIVKSVGNNLIAHSSLGR